MKKIIVNGGNFYQAFLVASYQNVKLAALEWLTLVEEAKKDTIYIFEVTRTPELSSLFIYNGQYIVKNEKFLYNSQSSFTGRTNSVGNSIRVKSEEAITISINVYEVKHFVPVKLTFKSSTVVDIINEGYVSIFQFPIFEAGKTYKVKVTSLYSGKFAYYQSGLQYQNDNVVSGVTYEFSYTAVGNGNPMIRDWVGDAKNTCYLEVNVA